MTAWPSTSTSPSVGFRYDLTPTLRISGRAGPSFFFRDGDDTEVTPFVAGDLTQIFKWGVATIGFSRAVTADTNGLSDRQTLFGSIVVPTLVRGLTIGFAPRYSRVDREIGSGSGGDDQTIETLTLGLRATYQIALNISLLGAYNFFHETNDRSNQGDIDQNRVFFGIQYAYPIVIY